MPRETQLPCIPGFEIEEEIGRGGMGVVYRARQLNLNRPVALKVLIAAHHAGSEQLERFRAEARNLAGLHHPGIVQIYDVGAADGLPYISMEFVPGGSLAHTIARQPLALRAAAQLVRDLAVAMHAAHTRGIIHRDLKPANILLSESGQPKITDFGIAKNLAATDSATKTGDVMGTPGYMAPEQAGGVTKTITPLADVYSLGAILYELLTGRPPFRGFDPVETLLAVLTEEPVSVRRLAPRVSRDLETICHKCLQKAPSHRYPSAHELAEDLTRFLDGRAIVARRLSAAGRAWRWARRRPAWALLIAVAGLFLVSFLWFATWKNRQLTAALENTERALDRSSENFREAIAAAARRVQRHGDPQIDPVREELLFFEMIRHQAGDSPNARWEQALAANWAGTIYAQLNEPEQAEEAFRHALAILSQLEKELPAKRRELAVDLAQAESRLAGFLTASERLDEAKSLYESALDRLEADSAYSPDDPERLRSIGAEYNNLAILLAKRGEDPAAAYERARELRQRLVERYPQQLSYQYDLAVQQLNQAAHLMRQADYSRAEALLSEALAGLQHFVRQRGADEEARRALTSCQLNLAFALAQQDRNVEANAAFREAIERLQEWVQLSPQSVPLRLLLIDGLQNWFNHQVGEEDWPSVAQRLEEMRAVYQTLLEDFPDNEAYRAGLEKATERLQILTEDDDERPN